jgi:putative transcriptional regulator
MGCNRLLAARGLTLPELADRVGVTLANLSVLKNGRARAIRFSTLTALRKAIVGMSLLPAGARPR